MDMSSYYRNGGIEETQLLVIVTVFIVSAILLVMLIGYLNHMRKNLDYPTQTKSTTKSQLENACNVDIEETKRVSIYICDCF